MKIVPLLQLTVALGLLNVWLVRFRQKTAFRGGTATTMAEEFAVYGLPSWSLYVVGALKVSAALLLIVGMWLPGLVMPASALVIALMIGAISMHLKIRDPWLKCVPALGVFALSLVIALNSR